MSSSLWEGNKNWDDHWTFNRACYYGKSDVVQDFLKRGYDPDERRGDTHGDGPIVTAVFSGQPYITQILTDALKVKYSAEPEKLIESLGSTRFVFNPINRWQNNFFAAISESCRIERDNINKSAMIADTELQATIATLPIEKQRIYRTKYPPLALGQRR